MAYHLIGLMAKNGIGLYRGKNIATLAELYVDYYYIILAAAVKCKCSEN